MKPSTDQMCEQGYMFNINELFTSIQGEGYFTGIPAHFIRFQGCPVKCHFCDTPHSWPAAEKTQWVRDNRLLEDVERLVLEHPNVEHIVLTGGEPMWNNPGMVWLIHRLYWHHKLSIQIETSGTVLDASMADYLAKCETNMNLYICVSPKAPKPTDEEYMEIMPGFFDHIWQLKFPVASELDIEKRIPAFLHRYGSRLTTVDRIYLQPVAYASSPDLTAKAQKLAVDYAMQMGFGISLQTHKILNVR